MFGRKFLVKISIDMLWRSLSYCDLEHIDWASVSRFAVRWREDRGVNLGGSLELWILSHFGIGILSRQLNQKILVMRLIRSLAQLARDCVVLRQKNLQIGLRTDWKGLRTISSAASFSWGKVHVLGCGMQMVCAAGSCFCALVWRCLARTTGRSWEEWGTVCNGHEVELSRATHHIDTTRPTQAAKASHASLGERTPSAGSELAFRLNQQPNPWQIWLN